MFAEGVCFIAHRIVHGVWVPAFAGTTIRYDSAFSRHGFVRGLQIIGPRKERGRTRPSREGAGKTGCALHPRSHVQCASKESAHEHTGSAETLRPSLRSGSTAYIVLSLVNRSLLPPSPPRGVSLPGT